MTKSQSVNHEESFVSLIVMAAEFAANRGGIDQAKQALQDAGRFIEQAGSVTQASQALDVLEKLRVKVADSSVVAAPAA